MITSFSKLALVSLAASAVLSLASCGDSGKDASSGAAQARREELAISPKQIADRRQFSGVISAEFLAQGRARIPGVLTQLRVREGDSVKVGDVLAQIEDRRIVLDATAAGARASAAKGEAERAEAELRRTRELFEQGIYAPARLEQDKARADAATGALTAARAQHAASLEMVAQGAVLAPADGLVLRADIPVGAVITPGQAVVTLTAGPPIVRVDVPETQAKDVTVGLAVTVTAGSAPPMPGKVERIYAESVAGNVRVDVSVPEIKQTRVGSKVAVAMDLGWRTALIIPARFVRTQFGLDTVDLRAATPSAAPATIAVQLAPGPTADQREVIAGVSSGDVLVAPEASR